MKSFGIWQIPVAVLAFGAALVLSPACKAQAEVSPDHFDGNEPWAVSQATVKAAPAKVTAKAKPTSSSSQARANQTTPAGTVLAAKHDSSTPVVAQSGNFAVADKRKPTPASSSKQQ